MAYNMREPSEFKVWLQINLIHKVMPYKTDQRLKQTGLQILKKLQTLGSQINWSANFKETTGETNLGSQITARIENGISYW